MPYLSFRFIRRLEVMRRRIRRPTPAPAGHPTTRRCDPNLNLGEVYLMVGCGVVDGDMEARDVESQLLTWSFEHQPGWVVVRVGCCHWGQSSAVREMTRSISRRTRESLAICSSDCEDLRDQFGASARKLAGVLSASCSSVRSSSAMPTKRDEALASRTCAASTNASVDGSSEPR
jgi:hypothetical protein